MPYGIVRTDGMRAFVGQWCAGPVQVRRRAPSAMYLPAHFAERRPDVLRALIAGHPLATLVTVADGGIAANHIPLQWHDDGSAHGVLRGHVARANPLWHDRDDVFEPLAIFHGPQAYVSPSWYATKQEHGRVVPTWNYCTVHAYGRLAVHPDAEWLRALVEALTRQHEGHRERPWAVGDAPDDYVQALLGQIVGIELAIRTIAGKWKVSQNQPGRNRIGVIAGLRAAGGSDAAVADGVQDALRRGAAPEINPPG